MSRTDIINAFIQQYNFKKYLEIGTHRNENFSCINCDKKVSVDPDPEAEADFLMTSDNFFAQNKDTFDIIFIDGYHEAHQVYKDIHNALKCLNEHGIIVCHDCNPTEQIQTIGPENYTVGTLWTGDTWKGFVKYRFESQYMCYVIDEDFGCGIIDTNIKTDITEQIIFDINEMTWDFLEQNRSILLNLQK